MFQSVSLSKLFCLFLFLLFYFLSLLRTVYSYGYVTITSRHILSYTRHIWWFFRVLHLLCHETWDFKDASCCRSFDRTVISTNNTFAIGFLRKILEHRTLRLNNQLVNSPVGATEHNEFLPIRFFISMRMAYNIPFDIFSSINNLNLHGVVDHLFLVCDSSFNEAHFNTIPACYSNRSRFRFLPNGICSEWCFHQKTRRL